MTSVSDHPESTTPPADHPTKVLSTRNKRLQMIKIWILVLVTVLSIVFTIVDVVVTAQKLKSKYELRDNIEHSIKVSSIVHNLQNERSQTFMFLVSRSWNTSSIKKVICRKLYVCFT